MPRQNLNVDGKNGEKNGKVRKRGCLSSSPSSSLSSLVQNHRLKCAFLVGKKWGSTTPVPMWKMMSSSKSPSMENDEFLVGNNGKKAEYLSVSARKLAAILWEINGMPSPGVKNEILEDKISEVGKIGKERILESNKLSSIKFGLSDPFCGNVSERKDPVKFGSRRRRTATGFQKLQQADCNLGSATRVHNFLVQVDQTKNPCRRVFGLKNQLNNVHNGLTASKQLVKALIHICDLEQLNSTRSSLVTALKLELNWTYTRVDKLIQGHKTKWNDEYDTHSNQFKDKKVVLKELEIEKKLRRKTEKQNEKLGRELAETKVSLSRATKELKREKKAREITELVCDELARGVSEDKAEVEKLKRQSEKIRREIEKERKMFRLADVIREERVQMKLSEAKYLFEEKNERVEKLRNEFEAYLKSKRGEETGNINEIEKYLQETFPGSYRNRDNENKEDVDESVGSDLHSIELNMDDISNSFKWGDVVKNGSKRYSVGESRGRKKQENSDVFGSKGLSELITSHSLKRDDSKDEMERDKMIKDLRDHIVSCSRMVTSQDLDS